MEDVCKLCGQHSALINGHIIPSFFYRELKTTGGGYLRRSNKPNQRIQDGDKSYLLCQPCETHFSCLENEFKSSFFEKIIVPNDQLTSLSYEKYLLRFCVSISWRILYAMWNNIILEFREYSTVLTKTLTISRDFLQGNRDNVNGFRHYIILLGLIENTSHVLPENVNMAISEGVDYGLCEYNSTLVIYAKAMKFLLLAPITRKPKPFGITHVHPRRGCINVVENIHLPKELFDFIILRRCRELSMQEISEKQQRIINNMADKTSYIASNAFKAHIADERLKNK